MAAGRSDKGVRARENAAATPFSFLGQAVHREQRMHDDRIDDKRRRFLSQSALGTAAAIATLSPAMRASVWAAGSDAPEKKEVKVGFIQ